MVFFQTSSFSIYYPRNASPRERNETKVVQLKGIMVSFITISNQLEIYNTFFKKHQIKE